MLDTFSQGLREVLEKKNNLKTTGLSGGAVKIKRKRTGTVLDAFFSAVGEGSRTGQDTEDEGDLCSAHSKRACSVANRG